MGEKYIHVPVVDGSTILPAWGDGVTQALERIDALSIDYELLLSSVPFTATVAAKSWCTDSQYIYALSGTTGFYRRNVSTGVWQLLANFPVASMNAHYAAICRLGTNIYVIYGEYLNNKLYVYSITGNSWTEKTLPASFGGNGGNLSIISDGTRYLYLYGAATLGGHRFDTVGNTFSAIPLSAEFFSPTQEPTLYTGPIDGKLVNVRVVVGQARIFTRAAGGDGSDLVERGVLIGGQGYTACLISPSEMLIANGSDSAYPLSLVDIVSGTVKQLVMPRSSNALILGPDHYVYAFTGTHLVRFKLGRQWQSWMR